MTLSSILTELVDDSWYDAYKLSLNGVVHVENEVDVLASITAFDCYSKQKFPDIHWILVYVKVVKVLLNICSYLLLEILAYLLENLREWLFSSSIFPFSEISRIDFPEYIFDKMDFLNVVDVPDIFFECECCPLEYGVDLFLHQEWVIKWWVYKWK